MLTHGTDREARRVGSQVARSAATARTSGAIVNANGSSALTWKRIRSADFSRAKGEQQTEDEPADEHGEAFAEKHPLHRPALCTESHPNPDLARAPRHRVGFDAVNADRRRGTRATLARRC